MRERERTNKHIQNNYLQTYNMHKGILSGCTSLNLDIKGPTFREVRTHTHVSQQQLLTHIVVHKKTTKAKSQRQANSTRKGF